MRGVGVRGAPGAALLGHLVALAAFAIMLALVAPAADAAEEVAALPQAAGGIPAPEADYYTRRAKTILDAEKAGDAKQHPLAAPYPGMDVVVCEAGCPVSGNPEIVFLRPRFVSATSASTSAASKSVACVGGCYGNDKSAMVPDVDSVGVWTTTVETPIVRDKLSPIR